MIRRILDDLCNALSVKSSGTNIRV